jgi:hypothetical protein
MRYTKNEQFLADARNAKISLCMTGLSGERNNYSIFVSNIYQVFSISVVQFLSGIFRNLF